MRQTAAATNRGWLTLVGLVLFLGGLGGALIATGALRAIGRAAGIGLGQPDLDRHFVGARTTQALTAIWLIVVIGIVGVILLLLGLAWLIAQIPRSNEARPFRLHDDAEHGLTRCAPRVLSDAVERQIAGLRGVHRATAVIRGTASAPELTVRIVTGDRTDVQSLIDSVQTDVVGDLCRTLDTRLRRLALQVEIVTAGTRSGQITV